MIGYFEKLIFKKIINNRLKEKSSTNLFKNLNRNLIKKLAIILKPDLIVSDVIKFVILMTMCEKQTNTKFKFVVDNKLLKNKNIIKYAIIVELNIEKRFIDVLSVIQYIYNRMVENQLKHISLNEIELRSSIMRKVFKKALFNYYYNFDKDFYNYYDVLSDILYNIEYFFVFDVNKSQNFNSVLSAYGYNFMTFNLIYENDVTIFTSLNFETDIEEDNYIVEYLLKDN